MEQARNFVKVLIGSAALALFLTLLGIALGLYGIIDVGMARFFLLAAWASIVLGVLASDYLCGKSRRHIAFVTLLVAIAAGAGLLYLDRYAVHKRQEQDALNQPPPTKYPGLKPQVPIVKTPKPKQPASSSVQITQHGSGSGAVGSVTQGPGSAFSNNQQGGVTAGTVIVDAPPDREWQISPLQKAILCGSPATARIFAVDTQEAIRFSFKIADVLLNCGWNVPEIGTCSYAGSVNGVWIQNNHSDPAAPILLSSMQDDFPVRQQDFQEFKVGQAVIHVGDNGPIKESDSLPPCTMAHVNGGFKQQP